FCQKEALSTSLRGALPSVARPRRSPSPLCNPPSTAHRPSPVPPAQRADQLRPRGEDAPEPTRLHADPRRCWWPARPSVPSFGDPPHVYLSGQAIKRLFAAADCRPLLSLAAPSIPSISTSRRPPPSLHTTSSPCL
ncbi:hypothetical protein P154DRAFT_480345, partial [Amniculicola lignicola CBS 123094]